MEEWVNRKTRPSKGTEIDVRQLLDVKTGEVLDVVFCETKLPPSVSDDGFVKMWLKPFCAALNAFAIKKIDVFAHIVKCAEKNPRIYKRISDIASEVGCSERVVIDCLHLMEENDIIKRERNGVLHFNENVLFKGDADKRAFLYVQYRDVEPTARVMKVGNGKVGSKRRSGGKKIKCSQKNTGVISCSGEGEGNNIEKPS